MASKGVQLGEPHIGREDMCTCHQHPWLGLGSAPLSLTQVSESHVVTLSTPFRGDMSLSVLQGPSLQLG